MYNHQDLLGVVHNLFGGIIAKGFNQISLHQYTDPQGNTLYTKARLKDSQGKKQLRPFYFDTQKGHWQAGEPPFKGKKPLYLLHLLHQADTVWIFEGEQKAELMASLGHTATTTGGSTSISAHDLAPLAGKRCILWRDNDKAGIAWLSSMVVSICQINAGTPPAPALHSQSNLQPNSQPSPATHPQLQGEILAVDVDKLGLADKGDIVDYLAGCDVDTMHAKINSLPMMTNEQLTALVASVANPTLPATTPTHQHSQSGQGTNNIASDPQEWDKPMPLDSKQRAETPYPVNAFGDELAKVVNDIAYYTQVPTAVAGQCVLGVMSAIGQRLVNAPFLNSHIPASLFLITELPSGQGKTFANNLAGKALAEWEKARYLDYLDSYKDWETLDPKQKALSPKPKNQSFIVTDSTIEAVTDKFILDGQKDVFWSTDEAGQFFNGYSMKSETAISSVSSLIKLWDGSPVSKLRSQRGKSAQDKTNAYDARLTLDVMGQRVVLEPAMTNPLLINQGFLPRALLACPKSNQGYKDYNSLERLNADPYGSWILISFWDKCRQLLAIAENERANMPYADFNAKKALADYMQAVEVKQRAGGQYAHIRAFAGRMGENTARIACLLALFGGDTSVSVSHIERASAFVDYSINERLGYCDIPDDDNTDAQMLSDWLIKQAKRHGQACFGYSETQSRVSPKHLRKKAVFELAIDYLIEKEHIRIDCQDDKRIIQINPHLLA